MYDEPVYDDDGRQVGTKSNIDAPLVLHGDKLYDSSGKHTGYVRYGRWSERNPGLDYLDQERVSRGCLDDISELFRYGWYLIVFLFFCGGAIKACTSSALSGVFSSLNLGFVAGAPTAMPRTIEAKSAYFAIPDKDQEHQFVKTPSRIFSTRLFATTDTNQLTGIVKINSSLNLRALPNTDSNSVAKLQNGTVLKILGRNSGGSWLNVIVPSISKEGWVAAQYIEIKIPMLQIPTARYTPQSILTRPPRDTSTPIPKNTATPPMPAGIELTFFAEHETLQRGQCTIIHWGIGNVQAVYLDGQGLEGGYAEKQVCPNSTTTYTMRIVLRDVIERSIVVRVR